MDVSKQRLDACCVGEKRAEESFANDAEGAAALAAFCRRHGAELCVMEASGGLERGVMAGLRAEGVACALASARQVRGFARAMGFLEKTDAIDAGVIARFAAARGLQPLPPPGPEALRLKALVTRLRQVTGDLTVQKQRIASAHDAEMADSIREVIALLVRQSKSLEGEIASLIDDDPLWARLAGACREVKGVAGRTIAHLMAFMPELGRYSGKAVAKLAGLAPLADDSGKRNGPRRIAGGRAPVRSILFLVAAIAARFHKGLGEFQKRLAKAGKAKMTIRIALARKLLVILNAKARDARATHAIAT